MDVEQVVRDKVLLGTTPNGKSLYYVRRPLKSVRFIAFGDGGQLPAMLAGGFSSQRAAKNMVDSYLAKMVTKEIDEEGNPVVIKPKPVVKPKTNAKAKASREGF